MTAREMRSLNAIAGSCAGALLAIALIAMIGLMQHTDQQSEQRLRAQIAAQSRGDGNHEVPK